MLACLHISVSASVNIDRVIRLRKLPDWIGPYSNSSITFPSYGCIHSAYADHMRILIVHTHVPSPACPSWSGQHTYIPKVTRESIEEMVEMVREQDSLWPTMCGPHGPHPPLPQCPITCSMFLAFSRRPYTIHVGLCLYIRTALVLEVCTLMCQLCTLGQGCGSFSDAFTDALTDAWRHRLHMALQMQIRIQMWMRMRIGTNGDVALSFH